MSKRILRRGSGGLHHHARFPQRLRATRSTDGGEGVTQARSTQPDLILLDIQLPVFDGYEATWQIKADLGLKTTRDRGELVRHEGRRREGAGIGLRRLRHQALQPSQTPARDPRFPQGHEMKSRVRIP